MSRFVKINEAGGIEASSVGMKVLRYNKRIVINPLASDFVKAGFLPVVNDDAVAEEREGYVVSGEHYDYNGTHDGVVKSFVYTEAPVVEEEVEEEPNGEEA